MASNKFSLDFALNCYYYLFESDKIPKVPRFLRSANVLQIDENIMNFGCQRKKPTKLQNFNANKSTWEFKFQNNILKMNVGQTHVTHCSVTFPSNIFINWLILNRIRCNCWPFPVHAILKLVEFNDCPLHFSLSPNQNICLNYQIGVSNALIWVEQCFVISQTRANVR